MQARSTGTTEWKQGTTALKRLQGLDALRGLAAVYVLAFHVAAMPEPDLAVPAWLSPLVQMGGTGVALFFVVSAFSLCMTWPNHAHSGLPLRSFYVSRLFRIAPLFIALLLIMVAKDQLRLPHRYAGEEVAWNLSLLFGLTPQWQAGIVMGSWTIGVEVLFYTVFPLLAWFIRGPFTALVVLLSALVLATLGKSLPAEWAHLAQRMGILYQLPLFALGCLLLQAWSRARDWPPQRKLVSGATATALGLMGLLCVCYGGVPASVLQWIDGWYLSGICYGLILLGLLLCPLALLVNRLTVFLGTISYSLYLVHPFVLSRLFPIFQKAYAFSPAAGYFLSLLLGLCLSVLAAWTSYRLIERPGIALGRKLIQRLRSRPEAMKHSAA